MGFVQLDTCLTKTIAHLYTKPIFSLAHSLTPQAHTPLRTLQMQILTHLPLPHAQKKFKLVQGLSTETEWLLEFWQKAGLAPLLTQPSKISLELDSIESKESMRFLGGFALCTPKKTRNFQTKVKIIRAIFGCTVSLGDFLIIPCIHSQSETQSLRNITSEILVGELFEFTKEISQILKMDLRPEVRLGHPKPLVLVQMMAKAFSHPRTTTTSPLAVERLYSLWATLGEETLHKIKSLDALLSVLAGNSEALEIIRQSAPADALHFVQDSKANYTPHEVSILEFYLSQLFPHIEDWVLHPKRHTETSVLLVGQPKILRLFLESQASTFFKTDAVIVFFREIGLEITQAVASQLLKSFSVPATGGHVTLSYTTKMVGQRRERGWQLTFKADEGIETALSDNFLKKT